MRRWLFSFLGNNNVLVGFHVSWILTALSLELPGCSVINLGTEKTMQLFCFKMGEVNSAYTKHIAGPLATSFDRRIPAVIFRGGLDIYLKAQYDLLAEEN